MRASVLPQFRVWGFVLTVAGIGLRFSACMQVLGFMAEQSRSKEPNCLELKCFSSSSPTQGRPKSKLDR